VATLAAKAPGANRLKFTLDGKLRAAVWILLGGLKADGLIKVQRGPAAAA